ncbi:MAG: hypothetical protein QF590_03730 [Dehalococcoidia bacterium]|nr:hypothetical protein [Dehalococcoidia bacterium]MDP7090390.1 hypothetical protein [Dehalococcoidia bacterium]MDP7262717.1 hypothetical protein [Dehalococcoidia bacterium]
MILLSVCTTEEDAEATAGTVVTFLHEVIETTEQGGVTLRY